jgi:hypothetical protein
MVAAGRIDAKPFLLPPSDFSLSWRGCDLRLSREFRFERMVFVEFAYAENTETDEVTLFIYALHNGVAFCFAHEARRIGKDDFQ